MTKREPMHVAGQVVAIILVACVLAICVAGTIVLVDQAMESVNDQ